VARSGHRSLFVTLLRARNAVDHHPTLFVQLAWALALNLQRRNRREFAANRRAVYCMSTVSVRYIVSDVSLAIPFYTEFLGFQVDSHPAPGFAALSRGNLRLLLNQPGAGGAGQASSDGQPPAPGGWNRFQFEVDDLASTVDALQRAGCHFRSEIIQGAGGKQILLDDPSGNPIELFESS
jgi:predicted enzyme related to lactoylglutathione lyase